MSHQPGRTVEEPQIIQIGASASEAGPLFSPRLEPSLPPKMYRPSAAVDQPTATPVHAAGGVPVGLISCQLVPWHIPQTCRQKKIDLDVYAQKEKELYIIQNLQTDEKDGVAQSSLPEIALPVDLS